MRHRTAQPLPRYTRRKWLNGSQAWAYYFEPPTWARAQGDDRGLCPVVAEELGTDYEAAVRRVAEQEGRTRYQHARGRAVVTGAAKDQERGRGR